MADKKKKAKGMAAIRDMSAEELSHALEASRKAIYQIRREKLSEQQSDVKATRNNRKQIARILTLMRQRELTAGQGKR